MEEFGTFCSFEGNNTYGFILFLPSLIKSLEEISQHAKLNKKKKANCDILNKTVPGSGKGCLL